MDNKITIDPEEIRKLSYDSITDAETIRQIALWSIKNNDNSLNWFIKQEFTYIGLYPHVIQSFNMLPDKLHKKLK